MKITEITVKAARTFNHPHEQYSNLRPEVVLRASVAEEDNAANRVRELQAMAEGMVEDHKQGMLRALEELYQLKRAQDRLDEIRKEHPELKLTYGEAEP